MKRQRSSFIFLWSDRNEEHIARHGASDTTKLSSSPEAGTSMKSKNGEKLWGEMTAAEPAKATSEFDQPLPPSRLRPLSKANRARFERARQAGARGHALVRSLKLDPKLLVEAEAYAKRKKLTWGQLLERGLRRELAVKD